MRAPHFMTLARIDRQHSIGGCRHGIIHLMWARTTVRFTRDEFRRLARLLAQALAAHPPISFRDGALRVTSRPAEDCELQVGSLVLLLSPDRFRQLAQAAQEAMQQLDEILASGMWDQEEPASTPPTLLEQLQIPFSQN